MELVKTEEKLEPGKRSSGPNPFMAQEAIDQLKTGDTFRITVANGEKPYAIVAQAREAANTVGLTVSVKTDPTSATDSTPQPLKAAKSFRIAWVKPRAARKPKAAATTAPATGSAAKAAGKPAAKSSK